MKKKVLLTILFVMLLSLLVSFTVSAEEISEWSDITELDGMTDKATFGADGSKGATSRILMDDGITYPAYYIFKDSATQSVDFTEINRISSKSYTKANVLRVEIPNGITTVARLQGYTSLLEVVVPEGVEAIVDNFLDSLTTVNMVTLPSTVKSIGYLAFYKIGAVENFVIPEGCVTIDEKAFKYAQIKTLVIPTSVENIGAECFFECKSLTDVVCGASVIGKQAFKNCTVLESLTLANTVEIGEQAFHSCGPANVVIPNGCTIVNSYAFKNSQIVSVTVPSSVETIGSESFYGCKSLKEIYYHASKAGNYMFRDCSAVETLVLDNLTETGTYAFYGLTSLKSIELPETLTTVGDFSFSKLGVEEIVTPASLVNVGKSAFYSSSTVKRVIVLGSVFSDGMFASCSNLRDVVITSRVNTFEGNPFNSTSQNSFTIYFAGNDYEAVRTLTKGNIRFSGALCEYNNFNREDFGTQNVFVYGTDICAVYFDGHLNDTNPCVINCSRCETYGVAKENPVHKEKVTTTYESWAVGTIVTTCENEGCKHEITENAPALFKISGFSTPTEYGKKGLALGFEVNEEALSIYRATGKTISFGAYVASYANVTNDNVTDMYNYAKAIKADVTTEGVSYFAMKVTGFENGGNDDTKLCLGAYVVENGDVSYLQAGEAIDGCNFLYTTYNLAYANSSNK